IIAADVGLPVKERVEAVRDLAVAHPIDALPGLLDLLEKDPQADVRSEACRALSAYNHPDVPKSVLAAWKTFPPTLRVEAVNLLSGRKTWAAELPTAVGKNQVARTDLTDNTILRIRTFRDKKLDDQIKAVW